MTSLASSCSSTHPSKHDHRPHPGARPSTHRRPRPSHAPTVAHRSLALFTPRSRSCGAGLIHACRAMQPTSRSDRPDTPGTRPPSCRPFLLATLSSGPLRVILLPSLALPLYISHSRRPSFSMAVHRRSLLDCPKRQFTHRSAKRHLYYRVVVDRAASRQLALAVHPSQLVGQLPPSHLVLFTFRSR